MRVFCWRLRAAPRASFSSPQLQFHSGHPRIFSRAPAGRGGGAQILSLSRKGPLSKDKALFGQWRGGALSPAVSTSERGRGPPRPAVWPTLGCLLGLLMTGVPCSWVGSSGRAGTGRGVDKTGSWASSGEPPHAPTLYVRSAPGPRALHSPPPYLFIRVLRSGRSLAPSLRPDVPVRAPPRLCAACCWPWALLHLRCRVPGN